jgi:hypothetical protein
MTKKSASRVTDPVRGQNKIRNSFQIVYILVQGPAKYRRDFASVLK